MEIVKRSESFQGSCLEFDKLFQTKLNLPFTPRPTVIASTILKFTKWICGLVIL